MKLNISNFKSKLISFYVVNLLVCTVIGHYFVFTFNTSEIGFHSFEIYHFLCIAGFLLSFFVSLAFTAPFAGRVSKWLLSILNNLNSYWGKTPYILYVSSMLFCVGAYFFVIRHVNVDVFRSTGLIGLGFLSVWFGTPFVVSANAFIIKIFGSNLLHSNRFFYVLAVALIAYLPSFAIGARSIAATGLISFLRILDLKDLFYAPFVSLFRRLKIKSLTLLVIAFALVIFSSIAIETTRRGGDNFIASFIRVDGVSAIAVMREHLPASFEEAFSRGSTLFGEILWVPVPRVVIPDKPTPFTVQLVQDAFSYIFSGRGWSITGMEGGVSVTVIGEFLWAFGRTGPIIAGFLVGFYINILGSLMVKLNHSMLLSACAYLGAFVVLSAESFSIFMNASSILIAFLILSVCISLFISTVRVRA